MDKESFNKIKNLDKLPQLPQVMLKVLEVCRKDEISIDELIRVISSDTGLTARLMQILNSAWVNLNKDIQNIESAILYLGIANIKNLAISMSVVQVFDSDKSLAGFNLNRFWYHSFKCALMAQKIAMLNKKIDPDEAFLAGLMHDIGKLVLMTNYSEAYSKLLEKAQNDYHLAILEKNSFNITHAEIGEWLCQKWHLSLMICDAVLYAADSIDRVAYAAFPLVKTIYAVNYFCSMDKLADEVNEDDGKNMALIEIDRPMLEAVISGINSEVQTMADSLGLRLSGQAASSVLNRQALSIQEESFADSIAAELVNDTLKSRLKDHLSLYGTLETLLYADDIPSVINALEVGVKILFNASTAFCFLYDPESTLLTGYCDDQDKKGRVLNSIGISLSNKESLIVRSLINRKILSTLIDEGKSLAISDAQIMRLLACDVMFCIPMYLPQKNIGVIIMGMDKEMVPYCIQNTEMLTMLSKLTAVALDHLQYYSFYENKIQQERSGASSDTIRKIIHEINNPLLIVSSYLKMLSLKLPKRHPAQNELGVIDEEIERIGGLVRELSVFANPPVHNFEWVDLGQLFRSLLEMVKKSILTPNGIDANITVEDNLPHVKTDKNSLKQIFINLLKNSSEAMTMGGQIHINLKQVPGSVKIMIDERKKTAGQVEIVVKDTGPGISEEILKHLFEPYNSSKNGRNLGLGLSIVNSTVKNINGTIDCHTKENVGTEFKIVLPIFSSPSVASKNRTVISQQSCAVN